jgi:hypothetical protein
MRSCTSTGSMAWYSVTSAASVGTLLVAHQQQQSAHQQQQQSAHQQHTISSAPSVSAGIHSCLQLTRVWQARQRGRATSLLTRRHRHRRLVTLLKDTRAVRRCETVFEQQKIIASLTNLTQLGVIVKSCKLKFLVMF